jgi:hypothetical protein
MDEGESSHPFSPHGWGGVYFRRQMQRLERVFVRRIDQLGLQKKQFVDHRFVSLP